MSDDIKARVERARGFTLLAEARDRWEELHEDDPAKDRCFQCGRQTAAEGSRNPLCEQCANQIADRALDVLPALAADCERLQGERQAALDVARIAEQNRDWALLRLNRDAARLADEVDVLVRRKVIDHRSPAADALLDFREPPSTERSCRLAELEQARDREKERADRAEQSRDELTALMQHAKDFARNAAPILRLHKQLVEAAKAGDDRAVNGIVAELGLIESPL